MSKPNTPSRTPQHEANVGIDPASEVYVVVQDDQMALWDFDAVMDRIERYSIELLMDRPPRVVRGSLEAYDTMRNLQAALIAGARRRGPQAFAVSELSPQLMGWEGRRVIAVSLAGDRREFAIGRTEGPLPHHVEVYDDGRELPADLEYQDVEEVR